MYSTQQQQPYSYHNFAGGNQHYNGDEARWNTGNPRSVSSEVEQLWRMDEPALFESLQYDGNYVFQDYPVQNQTSTSVSSNTFRRVPSFASLTQASRDSNTRRITTPRSRHTNLHTITTRDPTTPPQLYPINPNFPPIILLFS